jgi:hypothetical protein
MAEAYLLQAELILDFFLRLLFKTFRTQVRIPAAPANPYSRENNWLRSREPANLYFVNDGSTDMVRFRS